MTITYETYLVVRASGYAPQAEQQGPRASYGVFRCRCAGQKGVKKVEGYICKAGKMKSQRRQNNDSITLAIL